MLTAFVAAAYLPFHPRLSVPAPGWPRRRNDCGFIKQKGSSAGGTTRHPTSSSIPLHPSRVNPAKAVKGRALPKWESLLGTTWCKIAKLRYWLWLLKNSFRGQKVPKLGDQKCIPRSRKSIVGHPGASSFQRDLG